MNDESDLFLFIVIFPERSARTGDTMNRSITVLRLAVLRDGRGRAPRFHAGGAFRRGAGGRLQRPAGRARELPAQDRL